MNKIKKIELLIENELKIILPGVRHSDYNQGRVDSFLQSLNFIKLVCNTKKLNKERGIK